MTNFVEVVARIHEFVTRHPDPDDKWDNGDTEASITLDSAHARDDDGYNRVPVNFQAQKGQEVYVVWAQYTTGDSFGSYGGQFELCAVFDNYRDAVDESDRLSAVKDYSVPWIGYFDRLDSLNVEAITLT